MELFYCMTLLAQESSLCKAQPQKSAVSLHHYTHGELIKNKQPQFISKAVPAGTV
jgi:hypothetical protein